MRGILQKRKLLIGDVEIRIINSASKYEAAIVVMDLARPVKIRFTEVEKIITIVLH